MDWLTAEDWHDLGEAAIAIAGAAIAVLLINALIRWRFPNPARRNGSFADMAYVLALIPAFMLSDMFERRGISTWLLWLPMIPALLLPMWLDQRRQAQRRFETGADAGRPAPAACVPPSSEEKRVSIRLTLVSLALAAVVIGVPVLAIASDAIAGIPGLVLFLGFTAAILVALRFVLVGRWPGRLALSSEIDIAATPQQVWDTIRYVEGKRSYKRIVNRVERLFDTGESYLLHYHSDEQCPDCALPRDPDGPGRVLRVDVIESREPEFYSIRSAEVRAPGGDAMLERETESFEIRPLPGGHCHVVNTSAVEHPKMWLAILLKLGDPLGEHLRHLKSHVEGNGENTLWDTGAARIDATRDVGRFCRCPEGAADLPLAA
jgi:hypothetical protein